MTTREIVTPVFRANYVYLETPKIDKKNKNKASFEVTMIFDAKDDIKELEAIIEEAMQEKWGAKRPAYVRCPIRFGVQKSGQYPNGFDLTKNPEYEGKYIAPARQIFKIDDDGQYDERNRVLVSGPDARPIVSFSATPIYSGMYARALVSAYAYEGREGGDPGVAFNLIQIQKVKDGDKLGKNATPRNPSDVFTPFTPANKTTNADMLGV